MTDCYYKYPFMYKIATPLFIFVFLFSVTHLKAQTNSFETTVTNKTWIVSKYYISFSQEDKKDLFSNFSLKFLPANTRTFLAIDNSKGEAGATKGYWNEQSDKVTLFLNLEPDDKPKYRIALLLNKAEMQKSQISSTKLSFRIPDVMGYIDVEFTEK